MLGLGCAVLDVIRGAGILESMCPEEFAVSDGLLDQRYGRATRAWRGELETTIVGGHDISLVRNGRDQVQQEFS